MALSVGDQRRQGRPLSKGFRTPDAAWRAPGRKRIQSVARDKERHAVRALITSASWPDRLLLRPLSLQSNVSEQCAKTLTCGNREQRVAAPFSIAVRTPPISVGALWAPSYPHKQLPNASLGGSLGRAAAPSNVGCRTTSMCVYLGAMILFRQRLGGARAFMVRALRPKASFLPPQSGGFPIRSTRLIK